MKGCDSTSRQHPSRGLNSSQVSSEPREDKSGAGVVQQTRRVNLFSRLNKSIYRTNNSTYIVVINCCERVIRMQAASSYRINIDNDVRCCMALKQTLMVVVFHNVRFHTHNTYKRKRHNNQAFPACSFACCLYGNKKSISYQLMIDK